MRPLEYHLDGTWGLLIGQSHNRTPLSQVQSWTLGSYRDIPDDDDLLRTVDLFQVSFTLAQTPILAAPDIYSG